jgi:16S rRNA (adenine1518-N6/adenine1519-N6)-dimethyltransferase
MKTALSMKKVRPKKRFGQNFLRDQHVLDEILSAADLKPEDKIVEIGPGAGALTKRLIRTGLPVLAMEIDRDLVAGLTADTPHNLCVIPGDALRLDWPKLLDNPPYKLLANLPYNISSQVLFKVLQHRHLFCRLVLMFQKEVGDRLLASEGSRDYGILSVLVKTWFSIEKVVNVPPQAFYPAPKVDSVVLLFQPLPQPVKPIVDESLYQRFVRAAFAQRRKTIRNSLIGSDFQTDQVDRAFSATSLDSRRRGETLAIEEFIQLANFLASCEKGQNDESDDCHS